MIIGTAMLIRFEGGKILGLQCVKKRGIILPGGKVEKDETYREAAIRECFEESGVKVAPKHAKLVFQGISSYKAESYCFCYEATKLSPSKNYWNLIGRDFGSGKVGLFNWKDFMDSKYHAYYDALFQTVGIIE